MIELVFTHSSSFDHYSVFCKRKFVYALLLSYLLQEWLIAKMTRSGKRDTARVIEIRFYFDKHCKEAYFSLVDCLSPTLRLTSPFPLFQLEESDQIVQINSTDVRQCSPEQFRLILEGISLNEWSSGDAPKPPTKDQLQFLTYIKGKDLEPQKHLSKDQVAWIITLCITSFIFRFATSQPIKI